MDHLQCYEELKILGGHREVRLMHDKNNDRLCVRKVLSVYEREIYESIKKQPIYGIPKIYELYETDDRLIVYEEYIDGYTLDEILKEHGPAPMEWVRYVITGLSDILRELHGRKPPIIHRDIKTSNVIITKDAQVYLIDMNAARYAKEGDHRDTKLMGTQGYASPEQYGFGQSDARSDIYELGVLINVLLCGSFPSDRMIDGPFRGIIEKCIKTDRENRYNNIDELRVDLAKGGRLSDSSRRYLPPGFRSGKIANMFIATACNLLFIMFCFFLIVTSEEKLSLYNLAIVFLLVIAYAVTVFLATDYLNIHERLKLNRLNPVWLKWPIVILMILVAWLCIYGIDQLFAELYIGAFGG